jgi:hypothetical protein
MRKLVNNILEKFSLDRSTVSTVALLSGVSSFLLNILCAACLYVKEAFCGNLFPIFLLAILIISIVVFYFGTFERRSPTKGNPYYQNWDDEELDYES